MNEELQARQRAYAADIIAVSKRHGMVIDYQSADNQTSLTIRPAVPRDFHSTNKVPGRPLFFEQDIYDACDGISAL